MLQLVEGRNIYRHSLSATTRSTTKCTGATCAQSISGKVTRNLCSKRSSKQRQGLKIFGVEFGHPIFVSWLFFLPPKNGTWIFCCRFSVLEVAGTAPKPPQTYAERLQILDRMRMVREFTDSLRCWFIPPLASQSVSFANFQLLWSWTYQCIIYPILEEPPFFSLKTIFPWQFRDEKRPFLHRFFRLQLRRLLAKYPGFVGSGVDMPSHAWQWTNEELELFIGNFGSKLQRGWGSVGVELSWVELSWVGLGWVELSL